MDNDNQVENTTTTRCQYNKFLHNFSIAKQKDNTITKYFSKLNKLWIIEKQTKGIYRVNPYYFFKGSEQERLQMIRKTLEQPLEDEIKKHRHRQLISKNAPENP